MRKLLGILAFSAACFLPSAARAATCTLGHSFSTGETITASNLNASPISLVNCTNNLDHNNLGTAGVYASQVIPGNPAQATFGGAVQYTFPSGINLAGQSNSTSSTPLVFSNSAAGGVSSTYIRADSGLVTQGITDTVFGLQSAPTGGVLLSFDASGNLGILGSLFATNATLTGTASITGAASVGGNLTLTSGSAYIGGGGANQFAMTSNTAAAQTNGFTMNTVNNDTNIVQFLSASSAKSQIQQNGTYSVGGSAYGPTSASVNGALTLAGALSGTTLNMSGPAILGSNVNVTGALGAASGSFTNFVADQGSYLPPFLSSNGAVALGGSGAHITVVQPGPVVANGSCAGNTVCNGTPQASNLTGGGAFSSTVLGCWAGGNTSPWDLTWGTGAVTYQLYNASAATIAGGGSLGTPVIYCVGY